MNIKSLLLGSAAALAVVSGAQAADAVVAAEPEPMEYVRVCDAYGTGFFYIPGTETCLKIGGQFRYEKRWNKTGDAHSTYDNWSRGRIEITAKNDSEWGTVSSWIRLQGSHSNNRGNYTGQTATVTVDPITNDSTTTYSDNYNGANVGVYYTFGIGGLEFGYYDSQWAQMIGYGGRTDYGGDYINWDYGTRQYISYKASFDSITAVLSVEHDRNANFDRSTGDGKDKMYMPDVVGALSTTMGDYSLAAVAAYDESDNSFAIAKKVTADMGMFGITVAGFYSNSNFNSYVSYKGFSGLVGVSANVTDNVSIAGDFQVWDNSDYLAIADINWKVTTGFSVLLEGTFKHNDGATPDTRGAMLRFQRSF